MDPIVFLFGVPLSAWFTLLAWVHLRHPDRVWAAHARRARGAGADADATRSAPSAAWRATIRRRGTTYAAMAGLTTAVFGYLAANVHLMRR